MTAPERVGGRRDARMNAGPVMETRQGTRPPECIAGVLVGGASRRMGRAKALLPHPAGGTLVEHVVRTAQSVASAVVLLGQADALPPSLETFPTLPDVQPGAGPLAGLCALLEHAAPKWGLLLACDMPMVSPAILALLLGRVGSKVDAAAYARSCNEPGYHACCAVYHPRVLAAARDELATGSGALQRVLERVRVARIIPDQTQQRHLININTWQGYSTLGQ